MEQKMIAAIFAIVVVATAAHAEPLTPAQDQDWVIARTAAGIGS
jgi:hypothetical protein